MEEKKEKREIYIVISQTGTLLSRLLRHITKAEYNHASISLRSDLFMLYSFGRIHPYNPFWGGFVTESPHWGTFKRFSDTKVQVLAVAVSEEQYRRIRAKIKTMVIMRKHYHYNYLGLFLAALRVHYRRTGCYYCSEFVKAMLEMIEIPGAGELENIVKPIHFLNLPDANVIYCGLLRSYCTSLSS